MNSIIWISFEKVRMTMVREQTGPSGWSRDETMSVVQRSERSSGVAGRPWSVLNGVAERPWSEWVVNEMNVLNGVTERSWSE